jgi:hypothetical protein
METSTSAAKKNNLGTFYPENKQDEEIIKKYIEALMKNDHTYKPERINQILKKGEPK